jgi:CheY-like chemotaxis protein/transcriptional regulator with XRE-family HTH domain
MVSPREGDYHRDIMKDTPAMPTAVSRPLVLVVNDSPELVELMRELLEDEGYRVETSTVSLGLDEIAALQPDVVVQDFLVRRGAASAWALLQRLRDGSASSRVPVVLCTASTQPIKDEAMAGELQRLGVRVVVMPFAIDDLLAAVAAVAPRPVLDRAPSPAASATPAARPWREDGQALPRTLGEAIKTRRQELGWSQEELAARVVASGDAAFRQSDVSRLERGRVGLPHRVRLARIAGALGLSAGELLARSGWAGAAASFGATDLVSSPVAAPAVASAAIPVETEEPLLPIGDARGLPVIDWLGEASHLREVIAEAQATQARTREILARSAHLSTLYGRPGGVMLPNLDAFVVPAGRSSAR